MIKLTLSDNEEVEGLHLYWKNHTGERGDDAEHDAAMGSAARDKSQVFSLKINGTFRGEREKKRNM